MAADIGVGIIGYGLAGRVFHAPFISAVPGLALRAFVERASDKAAKAYPASRTYRTVEELLGDPGIELVVIGTPNATHFPLAKQALAAGKHVVVDKPFAETIAQAEELIALTQQKRLVLAPFHNRRWDGDFLTVRKILASGELGRLVTFESHFDRYKPLLNAKRWKEEASPANGLLMDLGPHLVDQALALFGMPQAVSASVRADRDESTVEDAFDLHLSYPHLTVWLRSTTLAAEPAPRFLLHGTAGSFRKYGVDPQEPALAAGAIVPPQGEGNWLPEPEAAWGELFTAADLNRPAELARRRIPTEPGDYRFFYANVRDAIRGVAELAVMPEAGRDVLRIVEAARASSATRRSIEL